MSTWNTLTFANQFFLGTMCSNLRWKQIWKYQNFPWDRNSIFSMNSRSYLYREGICLFQSHCFLWLCLNINKRESGTKHSSQSHSAPGDPTTSRSPVPVYPHVENFFLIPNRNFPRCNLWLLPFVLLQCASKNSLSLSPLWPLIHWSQLVDHRSPLSFPFLWLNKPGTLSLSVHTLYCRLLVTLVDSAVGLCLLSRSPKLYTALHI